MNERRGATASGRSCPSQYATDDVVRTLNRLHNTLAGIRQLVPARQTNAAFSELVELATQHMKVEMVDQILATPSIRAISAQLQALCAEGETQLERAWAMHIVTSDDPEQALRQFPYYDNYERLTRLEYHLVTALSTGPRRRVAFIGSGHLPLTSLLLSRSHGQTVDNIDVNPEACAWASRLASALGLAHLRFICTDVMSATELADYDLVVLAAMVGDSAERKAEMIRHLYDHMAPGALLLARSSHSLRTLLYPRLDMDNLEGFRPLVVIHPYTEVVNSVVVAEKPR